MILASTPFITLFLPHSTHINHSFNVTDHPPVSTYISIPTNPINIYNIPNTCVFYRALNASQLSTFHKHLSSLDSWMHNQLPNMDSAPMDELALLAEHTFTSLVNAYKLTTRQGHPHKPTSTEKKFTSAVLASNNSTINTATTKKLQNLINNWKHKKQKQLQKRLHHSLVASKNIKHALRNSLSTNSNSAIAFYDPTGSLTSQPHDLCGIMGQTLEQIGGPRDFHPDPQLIDSLMKHSPKIPPNCHSTTFTRTYFDTILAQASPTKASGFDQTNLYLFHITPSNIKAFLFLLCRRFLTHPLPKNCLAARIHLLYKKGDPHDPINYRPIALLNTVYKILASYAITCLTYYSTHYHIRINSQYGGIPHHRTSHHIYSMISNLSIHPNLYHLYLDLNKAFNSVPREALWRILQTYNFPKHLISLIQLLYSWPADYPAVNNFTLFAAMTLRGLPHGCPMSPILFNLFIDPILRSLKQLLPKNVFHELFSFINDIALRTPSPRVVCTTLKFLFTVGLKYGLSFNASKSELHALNDTPHVTNRITPSLYVSTCDTNGNPRLFYKYLGTYFLNKQQNQNMLALLTNTITSFFNNFAPLPLTHTGIIKLSNIQLIPIVTYRLIYNSVPPPDIHTLDTKMWTHIATQGKPSLRTPNKTKYSSRHTLGLDITKLSDGLHTQTINHTIRYLRNEDPQLTNTLFLKALNHDTQEANLIQTIASASSYYLNLTCHNIPNCNPTDLHKVPPLTTIQAAFDCNITKSPPPHYLLSPHHHPKHPHKKMGHRHHPIPPKQSHLRALWRFLHAPPTTPPI